PETGGGDPGREGRPAVGGGLAADPGGGLCGWQERAVHPGGFFAAEGGEAPGAVRGSAGGIQPARLWASGRGVSGWFGAPHPFFRLSSEVLAHGARLDRQG